MASRVPPNRFVDKPFSVEPLNVISSLSAIGHSYPRFLCVYSIWGHVGQFASDVNTLKTSELAFFKPLFPFWVWKPLVFTVSLCGLCMAVYHSRGDTEICTKTITFSGNHPLLIFDPFNPRSCRCFLSYSQVLPHPKAFSVEDSACEDCGCSPLDTHDSCGAPMGCGLAPMGGCSPVKVAHTTRPPSRSALGSDHRV